MTTGGIDLHIHSIASDGTLTVQEIAEEAKAVGLKAIAITDHDCLDGLDYKKQLELPLEVISGVELSTKSEWAEEIHILGYYLNPEDQELRNLLFNMRQSRQNRIITMVSKLNDLDIDISLARVKEIAGHDTWGRPHIARALIEKGYATSVSEAFTRYLEVGKPAYVSRERLGIEEGIKAITDAGGLAILAHPGLLGDYDHIASFLPTLKEMGLAGVEVIYPEHSLGLTNNLLHLTGKLDLLPTGGSDYHGPGIRDNLYLGRIRAPEEWLVALKNAI